MHTNNTHNPDSATNTSATIDDTSGEDQDCVCPLCDRTFTSRIGPVDHLRIHRKGTGEPVPEAPTYIRPHPPLLSTLPSHIRAPHGPIRPYAHPRKPAVNNHPLPPPPCTRTSPSPTTSIQLSPPTQMGSVLLDSISVRLLLHG
ncbi:hypothetical protein SprV_0100160300 [Sparganum proliferum]